MSDLAVIKPSGPASTMALPIERARQFLRQPAVQRSLPVAGIVGLGAATLLGWSVISAGPQRELLPGLADADKAAVAQALDAAHLAYSVDRATGTVKVSSDDFYKARMLLAAQGLPKSGSSALTPDAAAMPLGASEAVEREQLQATRESELARMIESIDVVETARVHLAEEVPSLFVRDRKSPTASVMLTMYGGRTLSADQVTAISNLVAASVPGLTEQAVTVVDQTGHLLSLQPGESGVIAGQLAFQAQVENHYRQALAAVLSPLVGPDGFTAQVHADLDWSATDATRESYPEAGRALRSEDQKWTADEQSPAAVGIPGALSNTAPPATTVSTSPTSGGPPPPSANGLRSQDVSRRFELGREVSVTHGTAGSVRRLSLAVALRDLPGRHRTPAEMSSIEALVRGAVGADAARGDIVAVSSRPFAATAADGNPLLSSAWITPVLRWGGLVLAMAAAWFLVGRRLLKRFDAVTQQLRNNEIGLLLRAEASAASPASGTVTLDMIEAAPSYAERAELVRNYVRQDPPAAARIMKKMLAREAAATNG